MYSPYPIYDRSGVDDDESWPAAVRTEALALPAEMAGAQVAKVDGGVRKKAAIVIGCVTLALVASLMTLLAVGAAFPAVVSPGILALTFGLRHAVDADHIAAIDNVTRKLVEDGQKPLTVGLYFSLGHSTVVVIMCAIVAWSSGYAADKIPDFARFAGLWGACFSSLVLLLFGLFNGWTAVRLWRRWRQLRKAGTVQAVVQTEAHEHDGEGLHAHPISVVAGDDDVKVEGPGCLTKSPCCRRIFASIDRPWKLYPVGFLFGLGFDTATEISLLAATAALGASEEGLPWSVTLVLPVMFTCGMSFIDTLDGIFMLWAYGWASLDRTVQVWFNFSLTAVSAFIAFAIALLQGLGLLQEELDLSGALWAPVIVLGEHSDIVGGSVVAFFVLSLAAATLYARLFLVRGSVVSGAPEPTAAHCDGILGGGKGEELQPVSATTSAERTGEFTLSI